MTDTDDKKVLKMSLICSLCSQRLTKPRSLPCFHTFCEACLKNYFVTSPEKGNAAKNGIPCPSCSLKTFAPKNKLPVENWAENFPVNQLVGTLIDIVPVSSRLEFCEPCKDSKVSKVAKSWCQQCSEALCDDCAKCHKSMKATRNHEITCLENMRSGPQPAVKAVQEEVMCQEHPKKDVDMYCQDHEIPCCAMCIATYHRKCNKICQINDILKEGNAVEVRAPMKEMDKLMKEAQSVKKERQEVMRSTQAQKTKLLQKIAETKKKLVDHIDKLEAQILAKFNAITETDLAVLQEQIEFCNSIQGAIDQTKTGIVSAKEQKLEKREFILTALGRKKYEECANGMKEVRENCAKIVYVFEEDPQVVATLKNLTMLGKLDAKHNYPNKKQKTPEPAVTGTPKITPRSVTQISFQSPRQPVSPQAVTSSTLTLNSQTISETPRLIASLLSLEQPETKQMVLEDVEEHITAKTEQTPSSVAVEEEKRATRRIKAVKVKVKGDRRECKITAIKLWNSNRMLLADHANCKLKLFNENGDLMCTADCSNPPWDFTFIDKHKCAVTIPNERKIKIYQVNENIKEVSWVGAARGCYGITMAGDDLAVTFSVGCIRIISLDGTVRMMVDTDYIGRRVFSNPEYITFNPFTSRLYVSDYNNHNVTGLKFENGIVDKTPAFVYRVSGPRGVSVDAAGNLYVCGFWSNDIHKVKDSGDFIQILKDALARPLCLAFSGNGDRFALSEQDVPNTVKVFRITPAEEADD